jgi:excisionase family DNA binding protein
MSEPLTLTIPEVAAILRISRNLAYELAARDCLPVPVLRLGRRMLVPRETLLRVLGVNEGSPAESGMKGTDDP